MKHLFWVTFSFLFISNALFSQVAGNLCRDKESIASKPCPLSDPQDDSEDVDDYNAQFPEEWILCCALDNAPSFAQANYWWRGMVYHA